MHPRLRSRNLIQDVEVSELPELANRFHDQLAERKAAIARKSFDWYPYDSFGVWTLLNGVLTGRARWLRALIGDQPVADIGCGDGSISFFLESLGCQVHAVDHPPTNFNRMQGVARLKSALRSSVKIRSIDLDAGLRLPFPKCGFALFCGVLYHLKNPFGVLEALAARSAYCLLTTAITQYSTDERTPINHLPVAFLAGRQGLRDDETNYWIFTEAGLRNLVERTGWDVCDWNVVDDEESTLWGNQRDQRVICLLRSRLRPPAEPSQLLHGWHKLENHAWRWTAQRFSLWIADTATVRIELTVPGVLTGPITLSGGGVTRTFAAPGDYDLAVPAPRGVLEFALDRALPPEPRDRRERGIVVRAVETTVSRRR